MKHRQHKKSNIFTVRPAARPSAIDWGYKSLLVRRPEPLTDRAAHFARRHSGRDQRANHERKQLHRKRFTLKV